MEVFLAVILILVMAVLWRLGGWGKDDPWGPFKKGNPIPWSGSRDVMVPVILGIWYFFTCNWITGILTAGAAQSIRMGYGAYDPEHDSKPSWLAKITKDREGSLIRGIYGAVTAFAIGLFPTIYMTFFFYNTFEGWYLVRFVLYIAMNVGIEVLCNKLKANVWITEPANGAGRGSILLWVR